MSVVGHVIRSEIGKQADSLIGGLYSKHSASHSSPALLWNADGKITDECHQTVWGECISISAMQKGQNWDLWC